MDDRLLRELDRPPDDYEWSGDDLKPLMLAMGEVQWALKVSLDGEVSAGNRGYKYATLPGMWSVLRPLLQWQKLLVQQLDITAREHRGQYVRLLTQVTHVESLAVCKFRTWATQHDARIMNATQAEGSALTYAKKRALMGVFGIAPEDLDGNDMQQQDVDYDTHPWTEFRLVMRGAEMNPDMFRDFVTDKYGQDVVTWSRDRLKRSFRRLKTGGWTAVVEHQLELEGEE